MVGFRGSNAFQAMAFKTAWIIESWTGDRWSDDASLLGHGCSQADNQFPSQEDAMVAVATLCHPGTGFDWRNLRTVEVCSQP